MHGGRTRRRVIRLPSRASSAGSSQPLDGRRSSTRTGWVEGPPSSSTDEVELSETTVLHHLRTLREHEVIGRIRIGRSFQYHPSDSLQEWMDEVGHAFPSCSGSDWDRSP
ncbi:hypothetical protein BRD56_12815 [Thermoplasmatales archaeon SW_10_69_26]|nr:MAG: hypothetical protein BRD56_12815 [Thermoplasmatales archaeon SW_10_69_26]